MLRKLDLAHAGVSDDKFSMYWTGHTHYLLRSEYPEWIAFCERVVSAFDEGHFLTVPSELMHKFGFGGQSTIIDTYSSLYRQQNDVEVDRQHQVVISDPTMIKRESTLWTLESIRKLIRQYLAFKLYQAKITGENINILGLKDKLVNEFAAPLARSFINNVFTSGAYYITDDSFNLFARQVESDMSEMIKLLDDDCSKIETIVYPRDDLEDVAHESSPLITHATEDKKPAGRSLNSYLLTTLLIAAGAVAGLIVFGVVVAATHGLALPFLGGIGAAILASHCSTAGGLALGISLFGAASAVAGAVVAGVSMAATYAASKIVQLFRSGADTQENKKQEQSSALSTSSTSLLMAATTRTDYGSTHPQEHRAPVTAAAEAKSQQQAGFLSNLYRLFGCSTSQASPVPVPRQDTPGPRL